MARIRNSGNGKGGIKFKRNLNISWSSAPIGSESSITGTDGTLQCAIVFGDPYASDAKGPISINQQEFTYYYNTDLCNLESSTGNLHKLVDGPFFKTTKELQTESIKNLTMLGSWVPNLPSTAHLNLKIRNLVIDNVYQIRCIFLDGKKKTSPELILDPGNHEIEYDQSSGVVIIGDFIAIKDNLTIQIKSATNLPPLLNCLIVRHTGIKPSVKISQLNAVFRSKA